LPIRILKSGATVLVDDEDADLVDAKSWHVYRIRPSMRPEVAVIEYRYGRMFRLHLHREVVMRMRPDLLETKRKFRVLPINGSYLDCRRENLEIVLARLKRGVKPIEYRPIGWEREPPRRPKLNPSPASPAWAGGLVVRQLDRRKRGGKQRYHLCVGRIPVSEIDGK
jgi:hypothetical protein